MKLIFSLFGKKSKNTLTVVQILNNLFKKKKPKTQQEKQFIKQNKKEFMENYKHPKSANQARAKAQIDKVLTKEFMDKPLSTSEKETLEVFNLISDDDETTQEYFEADSSWIIGGLYDKKTKFLWLEVIRGKQFYLFTKPIPRTKVLALMYVGGRFMWDYFGKKYSNNPAHWRRVSKPNRYSTKNVYNTKRFKNYARRYK